MLKLSCIEYIFKQKYNAVHKINDNNGSINILFIY
jgi:hypothetical protein